MRTVELSDEIYERAERAAASRGVPEGELVDELLGRELPTKSPESTPMRRVEFPLIHSSVPGTLRITKEMIDEAELEDDLDRSGMRG